MRNKTLMFKALALSTTIALAFPAVAATQATVYASIVYNPAASATLPWTATTIYNGTAYTGAASSSMSAAITALTTALPSGVTYVISVPAAGPQGPAGPAPTVNALLYK